MSKTGTGYFEDSPGNKSCSRLNGSISIWVGLFGALFILIVGHLTSKEPNTMLIATSAGTFFVTVAGPAMVFMYNQKKTEENTKRQTPINDDPA